MKLIQAYLYDFNHFNLQLKALVEKRFF